jgi:hypothetical protein
MEKAGFFNGLVRERIMDNPCLEKDIDSFVFSDAGTRSVLRSIHRTAGLLTLNTSDS